MKQRARPKAGDKMADYWHARYHANLGAMRESRKLYMRRRRAKLKAQN